MANTNSSKGNPAHKRMSNPNNAARRARSWKRGQERKALRRADQAAAHKRNVERVAAGGLTPHQGLNLANSIRPKVRSAPEIHHPVHTLQSLRDRQGNVKGWYVGRVEDEEVRTLRRSQNYGELVAYLGILNSWAH